MLTVEFSVLFAIFALVGGATLVLSLRTALPQVEAIRQALAECPDQREVRFTIREVVVHYDDGKVVPLRQRKTIKAPQCQTVRAAA